jgi:hypothetical protein
MAKASHELAARASAATRRDQDITAALDQVPWDAIHSLAHSSSRQRLAFFQVKGLRLSGWDIRNERRGCTHCPTLGPPGSDTFHIVWECPAAQRLWRTVRSWWAPGPTLTAPDSRNASPHFSAYGSRAHLRRCGNRPLFLSVPVSTILRRVRSRHFLWRGSSSYWKHMWSS